MKPEEKQETNDGAVVGGHAVAGIAVVGVLSAGVGWGVYKLVRRTKL